MPIVHFNNHRSNHVPTELDADWPEMRGEVLDDDDVDGASKSGKNAENASSSAQRGEDQPEY